MNTFVTYLVIILVVAAIQQAGFPEWINIGLYFMGIGFVLFGVKAGWFFKRGSFIEAELDRTVRELNKISSRKEK
jgi:hypothetical protein